MHVQIVPSGQEKTYGFCSEVSATGERLYTGGVAFRDTQIGVKESPPT